MHDKYGIGIHSWHNLTILYAVYAYAHIFAGTQNLARDKTAIVYQ